MRNIIAAALLIACATSAQAKTSHEELMQAVRVDAQAARDAISHHELRLARRHVDDALKLDRKAMKHDPIAQTVKRDLVVARFSLNDRKAERADHALVLVEQAIDRR
jgi:Tfp pilus assembly protein PilF